MPEFYAVGTQGELKHVYQHAARLGAWRLEVDARPPRRVIAVRARVLQEHTYWITQAPMDLVLRVADRQWTWRGVSWRRDGPEHVIIETAERPEVG